MRPAPATGDAKDWSWTTAQRCEACGFDPNPVIDGAVGSELRAAAEGWRAVLRRDDVAQRPSAAVWSPLEYACHVLDVHALFTGRVRLMLDEDAPRFANWDQDQAAIDGRYWERDPATVGAELAAAAEAAATTYDAIGPDGWPRTGSRSDGKSFTCSSIARYHLHEVIHHLHDVRGKGPRP